MCLPSELGTHREKAVERGLWRLLSLNPLHLELTNFLTQIKISRRKYKILKNVSSEFIFLVRVHISSSNIFEYLSI